MNTCKLLPVLVGTFFSLNVFAKNESTSSSQTPFVFLENKGQVVDQFNNPRQDIGFKLNAGALNVYFGEGQIHYQWSKNSVDNSQLNRDNHKLPLELYRMDVVLDGANKNAVAVS